MFRGKQVLVTGAASGIGRLMALAFARQGANVIVVDINEAGAEQVAEEARGEGVQAWAFRVDLADMAQIEALKPQVAAAAGRIDVLVNNAGVVFGGAFEDVPLAKHLLTYRINIDAMVAMTYAFFADLKASRQANIINIASAAGFIGVPYGTTYASSKWAAVGFSESLRQEFIEQGVEHIAVTTVCPGYIDTGMFNGIKVSAIGKPMTPEFIVARIMEAAEAGEPFVKEPFVIKSLDVLRAVLPTRLQVKVAQITGLSQSMKSWRGRASS